METQDVLQVLDTGALYAGYAHAFRYPDDSDGVLNGEEFLQAFDRSASEEAASIHEAAYVDMEASALFEELVRYYEHFGLRRKEKAELPDHLSVELEFMHFLCQLEHHAQQSGQDVGSVQNAQRDFIDRHIKRLLRGIQQSRKGKEGRATELLVSCADFVESHRRTLATDD